jgi:hypothetical protein
MTAKVLYDQHQTSPSVFLKAFARAVSDEYLFGLAKLIVVYLSADSVPPRVQSEGLPVGGTTISNHSSGDHH